MKKLIIHIALLLTITHNLLAKSPVPNNCRQLILVTTDSITATRGLLYQFERDNSNKTWQLQNTIIISLGRSGLGYGIGLHEEKDLIDLPAKQEGDGRSPAGVYNLGAVFGYKPLEQMGHLNTSYIHVTEMIECIDDANSEFYNTILSKENKPIDWESSEKMSRAGIYYEQGIVVEHNTNPVIKGDGSCIFVHNWAKPFETTAGCTVMEPADLTKIINWLDIDQKPVLVQLTNQLYDVLKKSWNLPEIN